MFHKIKSVAPQNALHLLVQFAQGVTKQYDVAQLIEKWPDFAVLQNAPGLFSCVQVDAGGYGVSWNEQLDISCNELWENGVLVKTPFDGLMSFSDATSLWGLNESTLRKAIVYGKLVDGVDVRKFGKQWIVTEEAMRREYGEPQN